MLHEWFVVDSQSSRRQSRRCVVHVSARMVFSFSAAEDRDRPPDRILTPEDTRQLELMFVANFICTSRLQTSRRNTSRIRPEDPNPSCHSDFVLALLSFPLEMYQYGAIGRRVSLSVPSSEAHACGTLHRIASRLHVQAENPVLFLQDVAGYCPPIPLVIRLSSDIVCSVEMLTVHLIQR